MTDPQPISDWCPHFCDPAECGTCADLAQAREEGHRAGLETAARLADELALRYRGDRFAPLDYREGWRDALSACARDLRRLEAMP